MADTSKAISSNIVVAKNLDDFYTKLAAAVDGEIIMMEGEGLTGFTGSGAPTTSTKANAINDIYKDTTNNKIYICDATTTTSSGTTYTWVQLIRATDIASQGTVGVISASYSYGTDIVSNTLYAISRTEEQYKTMNSGAFIGKGTLTNVLTAETLRIDGTAQTVSSANQTTARNTIGAVALAQYDSSATPAANTLYWVEEDD